MAHVQLRQRLILKVDGQTVLVAPLGESKLQIGMLSEQPEYRVTLPYNVSFLIQWLGEGSFERGHGQWAVFDLITSENGVPNVLGGRLIPDERVLNYGTLSFRIEKYAELQMTEVEELQKVA